MIHPGIYLTRLRDTLNQAKKLINKNFFDKKAAHLIPQPSLIASSQSSHKCTDEKEKFEEAKEFFRYMRREESEAYPPV